MAVINGTSGTDTLIGTSSDDEINALGGNDVIKGSGGADKIDGGTGLDTVDYSSSAEAINVDIRTGTGKAGIGGDAQGDTLTNIEKVIGTAFNDTFNSTIGGNLGITFEGGAGDDVYTVATTGVKIIEEDNGGYDELRSSAPTATLDPFIEKLTYIGTGSFTGTGNAQDNTIVGGAGNDTLIGGGGADQLIGGAGLDTASYRDSTVGITINLKSGVNSGIAAGDTYTEIEVIAGSGYNDTFVADGRAIGFDGGNGFDTVDYSSSAEAINVDIRTGTGKAGIGGDAQGDTLTNIEKVIGTAYNDTFNSTIGGNLGITFEGGAGDDVYTVATTGVKIIEEDNGGYDELRSSAPTATLDPFIEKLTYIGTGSFTGTGNAQDNTIVGGAGNDTLIGGGGADQLIGGAGLDTASYRDSTVGITINLKSGVNSGIAAGDTYAEIEVIAGSGYNDTFVADGRAIGFDGGNGFDTVDYSSSAEAINVDIRTGTGKAGIGGDAQGDTLTNIEKVIGTAFNDTFNSTIGGNLGIIFEGGAGDDVYTVATTGVKIIEEDNGGYDELRSSAPTATLDPFIEKLTYIGTGSFTGYGNAQDNVIIGGAGNDILNGGAGADQFFGGAGNDIVSYEIDSPVAVTINLVTGVHSGIAAGDTYVDIETIRGSNLGDIFYAGASAMRLDGAGGQDLVSYELAGGAVTLDLTTNANSGDAAGDTFINMEIYQGSNFNDTLSGSRLADVFIGGAGADVIDGREGQDSAWYITSATGVTINLQTGVNQGGDAEGDVLSNIERVVGSHFDDSLTGDAGVNYIEGALGNDVIYGGDGNDYLYGGLVSQIGPFSLNGLSGGAQADTLYGGNGNDTIITAANDEGSRAYGEAGGDVITVVHGMADGGEDNDLLTGTGSGFSLFGAAGDDRMVLQGAGSAFGGEGADTYTVNTRSLVTILDDGASGGDKLILANISASELLVDRVGDDLYLHRSDFVAGQTPEEGVRLKDWYAGFNTIEQIQTADNQIIILPANSDEFVMFG
ncbi:beta strand repeat-containing protein [Pseudomonas fluorescens]|uniref:beta strand repeat-containing protein n=1 Tax=Pseudomonas fluorescens TaxID=294 RepID=UPI0020C2ACC3|nr:calcium-binding protein [Pseudomonas fluorescens]UTL89302.1 calcium-binding protein [Pseudomonas fluorescens]